MDLSVQQTRSTFSTIARIKLSLANDDLHLLPDAHFVLERSQLDMAQTMIQKMAALPEDHVGRG